MNSEFGINFYSEYFVLFAFEFLIVRSGSVSDHRLIVCR